MQFPVGLFPRNLTFMEGNQLTLLLSRSGNCQNSVTFPILVREIEIKCLFHFVNIQNITETDTRMTAVFVFTCVRRY